MKRLLTTYLGKKLYTTFIIVFLSTFNFMAYGQFNQYFGNSENNTIRFSKILDNHWYIGILNNPDTDYQTTVLKLDLNGNLVWQIDLPNNSGMNDIAKQGNKLLLVGSDIRFNFSSRNSVFAMISDSGSSASLDLVKVIDFSSRDNFTKVISKPGSNTNFYIQQYYTLSGDTPAILEVDDVGNILRRLNITSSNDDQFWSGLKSDQLSMTLVGNLGGTTSGCYVELDENLGVEKAYELNGVETINDYIDRSDNRKVMIGYNNSTQPIILETDSIGNITWSKVINQGRIFKEFFFASSIAIPGGTKETYYIYGDQEVSSGVYRQYVIKFNYSIMNNANDIFEIEWTKYFEDSTVNSVDSRIDFLNNKFYTVTQKSIGNPASFGGEDLLISITNKNLNSCLTSDLSFTLSDITFNSISFDPDTSSGSIPVFNDVLNPVMKSYMTLDTCFVGACDVDSLFIGTGYDSNNDTTHPILSQDGHWILKEEPQNNGPVTLDSPAFVINKASAWSNPSYNTSYISAFNMADGNAANIDPILPPYRFQRCFCVEEDNSLLEFNIDVHVDNRMQLYFLDPNNTSSRFLLDEVAGSSANNFRGAPEHLNIIPYSVPTSGIYCIEAELRNDHEGSPMGMNISGWIKGASIIKDSCCMQTSYITGFKYIDKDCDGNVNIHDAPVEGFEIELYDESGAYLSSFLTDCNGYYRFEVQPGIYQVKEVLQTDWAYSVPSSGGYLNVEVDTNVVVQLNFGNIYEGPLVTDPLVSNCFTPGESIDFNWTGQSCDCQLVLEVKQCNSENWQPIADLNNTGSFTWSIHDYYDGEYEFQLRDCDDFEVPFLECVSIQEQELNINSVLSNCGLYEFSYTLTGVDASSVISHDWTIDIFDRQTGSSANYLFSDPGVFTILLMIETNDGCLLSSSIDLNVEYGANDPNCNFCPPNVLNEVDGDILIPNDKFGVIIQSEGGNCFRITVKDDGTLITQPVECP